ncbi:MAG: hypothetical protein V4622_07900 [Bacteroidota bacterium]
MLKLVLFTCFLSLIHFSSFSQFDLVDKSWKLFEKGKVDEAEKIMIELNKNALKKFNKNQKTAFYVNYGKILIEKKNYSDALNLLLKAKELNKGDSLEYERLYNSAFGELFQSIGSFSTAIEYKKKVYQQTDDDFSKFLASNSIGTMFYQLNQADSALYYFNLQLKSCEQIENKIYFGSSKNNIGLAYFQKKEFHKALKNFQEAESYILNKNNDPDFYFSVKENVGRCLYELKKHEKAIICLEAVHENDLSRKRILKQTFYQSLLVSCYLKTNKLDEAKKIEHALIGYYSKMSTIAKYHFLCMQHEISLSEKNYIKANQLFSKIKEIQLINEREKKEALNNSNKIIAKYLISEAKIRLAVEQKQKRNSLKALELEKKENNFISILSISIFVLFIIAVFVIYQNLKNKQKKAVLEKEFLKLEEEKLKLKIGVQEKNLTEFAIDFSKKKELNKEIISQLNFLSSLKESEIKQEIKTILTQLKTRQTLDKRVEDLNENSELILLHFKNKLVQLHPSLNKTEIELCSLIKLNLSNKEIASFRNISDDSVKIVKNRLKKKLNLDATTILGEYLAAIN